MYPVNVRDKWWILNNYCICILIWPVIWWNFFDSSPLSWKTFAPPFRHLKILLPSPSILPKPSLTKVFLNTRVNHIMFQKFKGRRRWGKPLRSMDEELDFHLEDILVTIFPRLTLFHKTSNLDDEIYVIPSNFTQISKTSLNLIWSWLCVWYNHRVCTHACHTASFLWKCVLIAYTLSMKASFNGRDIEWYLCVFFC